MSKERKPILIFVNSVKGGAGKTTVSLSLAITLLKNLVIKVNESKSKESDLTRKKEDSTLQEIDIPSVCYIDADLMGTGVKRIIFNDEEKVVFFNDRKESYKEYLKDIKLEGFPLLYDKIKVNLQCILLSDKSRDKGRYVKDPHTRTSHVNMNVFENRFKNLLIKLIEDNNYNYIIIDCASGYESLSRSLIAEANILVGKEPGSVYNLLVTTLDKAHMYTTLALAYDIIGTDSSGSETKIIINDTCDFFSSEINISPQEFDKQIRIDLDKLISSEINNYKPSINAKEIDVIFYKYTNFTKSMIYTNGKQLHDTTEWKSLDDNAFANKLFGRKT